ncbi:hypothetical protein RF11_08166 [Thelohanellus kitauei]|uniref:Uncharacterized protein n=1 Tax=Thelohanellus kitauei TaxID=669202 RepID=A0A0C2N049_THEKT|nr:hypothetical protein RF11_08166 [Thelohanellus kitauei]
MSAFQNGNIVFTVFNDESTDITDFYQLAYFIRRIKQLQTMYVNVWMKPWPTLSRLRAAISVVTGRSTYSDRHESSGLNKFERISDTFEGDAIFLQFPLRCTSRIVVQPIHECVEPK